MSRIYFDSMLLIYALEANPVFGPAVQKILKTMSQRKDVLCTSVFSVGEVLTGPMKLGSQSSVDRVRRYFSGGSIDLLPFTVAAAERYAAIRAHELVSPPDAIHLACAATAGVDVFVTNDKQLIGRRIQGIQFIVGLDGKIL